MRCPVHVLDLAAALLELASSGAAGIHHLAGTDALSRHELGTLIATRDGLDASRLPTGLRADSTVPGALDVRLQSQATQRQLRAVLGGEPGSSCATVRDRGRLAGTRIVRHHHRPHIQLRRPRRQPVHEEAPVGRDLEHRMSRHHPIAAHDPLPIQGAASQPLPPPDHHQAQVQQEPGDFGDQGSCAITVDSRPSPVRPAGAPYGPIPATGSAQSGSSRHAKRNGVTLGYT